MKSFQSSDECQQYLNPDNALPIPVSSTATIPDLDPPFDPALHAIIYTKKGEEIYVDAADYQWLNQYHWHIHNCGYASACFRSKSLFMQGVITRAPTGVLVDHKNRNRVDNRRINLRPATRSQNAANRSPSAHSATYRGLTSKDGKWRISIMCRYRSYRFGVQVDPVFAAQIYDAASQHFFGEFGYLNFPDQPTNPLADQIVQEYLRLEETRKPKNLRPPTSRYVGVSKETTCNRWRSNGNVHNRSIYIGMYATEEEAAHARDRYVIEHNLNCKLNFPRETYENEQEKV